MRYRSFILIRNSVLGGLIVLGGFGLVKGCRSATAQQAVTPPPLEPAFVHQATAVPAKAGLARRPPAPAVSSAQAANAAAAAPARNADREPLADLHREVLDMAKKPLTSGTSDGSSSKWRVKKGKLVVELRSDTSKGSKSWNRLKIDLDGDKSWDEAWDLKPGKPVKRRVAPSDDENYSATYDLQGNTWVRRTK